MLSKLEFFETRDKLPESPIEREGVREAVERHFRSTNRAASVTPASGGTLGVCFHADVAGARRFLKTHLPGEQGRANLAKEGEILVQLYGEAVVLERIEVQPEGGGTRLCLLMAELSQLPAPMAGEEAAAMARTYRERLDGFRPADLNPGWDFEHYLGHGRRAIAALSDQGLVGCQTAATLERLLDLLERELGALPRALCHGDLGPKNIMTDGSQPVAIDWEDAFWGVAGYDYLYWLTFMDNRPFLLSSAFGKTGLDADIERAMLALVVLLKSFLSVLSGGHLRNTVPIETRVAEVLALPRAAA